MRKSVVVFKKTNNTIQQTGVPTDVHNVEDLIVDLGAALGEVAQFHGIDVKKTMERRDDKNEIRIITPDLGSDCIRDIERCAELFGFKVVNEYAGKSDKSNNDDDDEDGGHHHHHGSGCC